MNNNNDPINSPSHYKFGKIEVIEAIEDWQLPYHLGNVVKYVARAGRKDPSKEIQDLEKAAWYLQRYIELKKGTAGKPDEMRSIFHFTHPPELKNMLSVTLSDPPTAKNNEPANECRCGHSKRAHNLFTESQFCRLPGCNCEKFQEAD